MQLLGFEKEELDTKKRKDYLRNNHSVSPALEAMTKELKTIHPEEVDDALVNLRYKHYQQRLLDRINKVIETRKQIKLRNLARSQLKNTKLMNSPSVPQFHRRGHFPDISTGMMPGSAL